MTAQNSIKKFAVIGNPIAHSRSPEIHQAFGREMSIRLHYDKILAPLDQFANTVHDFLHKVVVA